MKYSVIFTGIVALSSDLVTRSNAATLYGNSTTAVVTAESGSETTSKGPKFPVTLYSGKKGKKRTSLEKRRHHDCNGPIPWTKHGKKHCGALGAWPCYRRCVKTQISSRQPLNPNACKHMCKKYKNPWTPDPDCSTSSDDEFGCTIPELREEVEDEKNPPKFSPDPNKKDEEKAQEAFEQWKKAMEAWRKKGSPPDKKPKIGDYWEPVKIEDEEDAVKRALEQWKKEMEEWRKNGSRPYEKPKMGDHLPARRAEHEAMEALEHVQRSTEEWRHGGDQLYPKLNERGKRFNCTGDEIWTKHGKAHCAAPGRWPCYGHCLRDSVLNQDRVRSGKCKRFCKKNGSFQPGDCTTSSDDEFGCNLPRLLDEVKAIEAVQNSTLYPTDGTATNSTDKSNTTGAPPRTTQDPEALISQLQASTKKPEPSGL